MQIDLPAGSHVRGEADLGAVRCTGRLGDVHFKTGLGEIRLDQAGQAELKTGGGDIIVDHVADQPSSARVPALCRREASAAAPWSRTATATPGSARSSASYG